MTMAFVFPGQGSQQVGMGEDFYQNFPSAREVFARASEALQEDMAKLCFQGPAELLKRTDNAQPALLTVSIAVQKVIKAETGLEPAALAGHSLGEYSALVVSGALDLEAAVSLVRLRGRLMEEAAPAGVGGMGAILGLDRGMVEDLCRDAVRPGEVLVPANFNCPGQIVISGHASAVKRALEQGSGRGAKRCLPLEVSGPFHSPLMEKVEAGLREAMGRVSFGELQLPVVANYNAEFYRSKEEIPEFLARQVCNPVRWEDSVHTLRGFGIDQTIEVGPGRVLSGLVRKTDSSIRVGNVEDLKSLEKFRADLASS